MSVDSEKMRTILIVDDELDTLSLLTEFLEDKKFKIICTDNPNNAISIIEKDEVDLVIADLKMPEMDGIALTKEILSVNSEMPVIIMTAYASIESAIESIKAGATDFITKPFKFNHTHFVVNKALERRALTQLAKKSVYYKKLSQTDELTGLFNLRSFKSVLNEHLKEHGRLGKGLSLMMADIDDFKRVNDNFGHQSGDKVLADIASILSKSVRGCDFLARYGGEEFAVVLPETGKRAALKVGQRILEEIESFRFKSKDEISIGLITITIGLATFPRDGRIGQALLESADKALYKGKEMGKNRICTVEECF